MTRARNTLSVIAIESSTPRSLTFRGRDAWALSELLASGERGCTPIDHPGPRWSGYVHKLRRAGLAIETVVEPHSGPFAGRHARYVLRTRLEIVKTGQGDA